MENLGKYLQEQREGQNVSIDEMAFRTKIPVRYIHAIERNQFDQIPSQVSAKGFLRSYVRCLRLDDKVVLEAFSQEVVPAIESFSSSEYQDGILSYLQVKTPSRLPFPRRVLLLVGGVVFLLLLLVGLLPERDNRVRTFPPSPPLSEDAMRPFKSEALDPLFKGVNGRDDENLSNTEREDGVQSPGNLVATEEALTSGDALPKETISTDGEQPHPLTGTNKDLYVLSIEATEPSWVLVEIDGKEVREALLQPNDIVKWRAKEKFLLKLGNAGGVRVSLNGQDLGSFGPSGEVVEKEIIGATTVQN